MSEQASPPVIVIRRKTGHGGHHGGAWKVAYADFVTAMMALFIVLWLMNTSEQVKKAISAYFSDPSGIGKQTGSATTGTGETVSIAKDDMANLKEKLQLALKKSPEFEKLKDYIAMTVTGEGLRVEMLESEHGTFFESGKAVPTDMGEELIQSLAKELGQLPNDILIEGHTDSKPFGRGASYSNWELSTDRANAARRVMESSGLRPGQVIQVRGFADHDLRDKSAPEAASNRRISVIVRYQAQTPVDPASPTTMK
ncbi:MAG: flagellar motor protein MotB [Bryobacteraceae bacterium]